MDNILLKLCIRVGKKNQTKFIMTKPRNVAPPPLQIYKDNITLFTQDGDFLFKDILSIEEIHIDEGS